MFEGERLTAAEITKNKVVNGCPGPIWGQTGREVFVRRALQLFENCTTSPQVPLKRLCGKVEPFKILYGFQGILIFNKKKSS